MTPNDDKTRIMLKPNTSRVQQRPLHHEAKEPPSGLGASSPDGTMIGCCIKKRYLIEAQIGTGGMSDVYRAKDLYLADAESAEHYVAIKVLQKQFLDMDDARQIVLREARKTQQLSHPNIVRVYDVDTDGDINYMVMELLHGESLEQVIKRSKPFGLAYSKAIKLISQIADALNYAHKEGIVHTDLKPSNIMLTSDGQIKVFDFGVARALRVNFDQYAVQEQESHTQLGGYTPTYASKEQLAGKSASVKDDIYSFSCLVYELLSSKHPFNRIAADEAEQKKLKLKKPPHISRIKWSVLKKGLSFDAKNRDDDIGRMHQLLKRRLFPVFVAATLTLSILSACAYVMLKQYIDIYSLNSQITAYTQMDEHIKSMLDLEGHELLSSLDALPPEYKIEREGILHLSQERLFEHFQEKIANTPFPENKRYPNYLEITRILSEAKRLFPDSQKLIYFSKELNRARQSKAHALMESLHLQLDKGEYFNSETDPQPYAVIELAKDLQYIAPNIEFMPSNAAIKLFQNRYKKAQREQNLIELERLTVLGKNAFYGVPKLEKLFSFNTKTQAALSELG